MSKSDNKVVVGDCVFIDCRKAYSHSTSDNLWSLQWCHFYAPSLQAVYEKYKERGGRSVFHPDDLTPFTSLLTEIYDLASSSDYIRDMRINEKLAVLLTLLMEQSWHPESMMVSRKRVELLEVKSYLDEHYTEKIVLDDLAERFFINKFYMTRIFKETYGTTINNYLISRRITRAKQLLRFTDMTVDEIGNAAGIHSAWKNGCKKLEFLGSSCIYPRMAPQPMKENCLLTSELEKTNEAYALAKISGLKYCEFLNRQYGTDYI